MSTRPTCSATSNNIRFLFAYTEGVRRILKAVSPSALRCELSQRNAARAAAFLAEMSYSAVPSMVYAKLKLGTWQLPPLPRTSAFCNKQPGDAAGEGLHRLAFSSQKQDRTRGELECANSSDALLDEHFLLSGDPAPPGLCSLLGIPHGIQAEFGVRPGIPLRTEPGSNVRWT